MAGKGKKTTSSNSRSKSNGKSKGKSKSKGGGLELLTQDEIRDLLRPQVEIIKNNIKEMSKFAIARFYADYEPSPDVYKRSTPGFNALPNIEKRYSEKNIPNGIQMNFSYSADDVTVSTDIWKSSNPAWAFDKDFLHGYHGGPHHYGGGIGWTWAGTHRTSPSPFEIIEKYIKGL